MQRTEGRELFVDYASGVPVEQVLAMFTDVHHLAEWWPLTIISPTLDFRVGGELTFVSTSTERPEWIRFTEIVMPVRETAYRLRIALMHGAQQRDDPEALELIFEAEPDNAGTAIFLRTIFPTRELLEAAVADGARARAQAMLRRLDAAAVASQF